MEHLQALLCVTSVRDPSYWLSLSARYGFWLKVTNVQKITTDVYVNV